MPDIVADDADELEDVPVATFVDDEDSFRFAPDLESFVRVLLIVIFIPSELCFTIYSAGFFVSMDEFLLIHLPSVALFDELQRLLSFWPLVLPLPAVADFVPPLPPSSVQCWAFFNLSMTALNEPLRFLACC